MPRSVAAFAALAAALVTGGPAAAGACPSMLGPLDPGEVSDRVDDLERLLEREHRHLEMYRVGWASTFAIAAIGQVGLAELVGEPRDAAIYVSAFKATLGASVTPFLSPDFEIPARPVGQTPCARLEALEATLQYVAERERRGVALYQHGLGVALNLAGLLYLGLVEDQWLEGLAGALVGSAVGELRLWTQPRTAIESVEYAEAERSPWLTVAPMGLGARLRIRF